MSTLGRLPFREVDRLSAYLDGALPPGDRRQVEARLAADPVLRSALEELRQVRAALRSLPEPRLPRQFTLRAAALPRRATPAYPYLRFATALAVALFAVTTGLRALGGISLARFTFGAAAPAMEPVAELAAEAPPAAGAFAATQPAEDAMLPEALALVATGAPSPTSCPDCPTITAGPEVQLRTPGTPTPGGVETTAGEVASEKAMASEAEATPSLLPAAQWMLGLAAVVLGVLTVRARRAR